MSLKLLADKLMTIEKELLYFPMSCYTDLKNIYIYIYYNFTCFNPVSTQLFTFLKQVP